MEKYLFLPHTADAKFQAFGETLEEAFANAALAMYSIMVDTESVQQRLVKKIEVQGTDLKSLLVNFLEEFIVLLDSEAFLLCKVDDLSIDRKSSFLTATIIGDTYSDKYDTSGDVKAVTYSDMHIQESLGKCMVQVVVDL